MRFVKNTQRIVEIWRVGFVHIVQKGIVIAYTSTYSQEILRAFLR